MTVRRYRWRAAVVLLTLAAAAPAPAEQGFFLEDELRNWTSDPPTIEIVRTWIVPGKMRKEESARGTVTLVVGERWRVLDLAARTYFELDPSVIDRVGRLGMAKLMGDTREDPRSWLVVTGKRKRVGSWDARELRIEDRPVPGTFVSVWLSDDVPIGRELRDQFQSSLLGEANPAGRLLAGLADHTGYPVEVALEFRLGSQVLRLRRTLRKVEAVEVPADRFELPEGFRRVEDPFSRLLAAEKPAPEASRAPQ